MQLSVWLRLDTCKQTSPDPMGLSDPLWNRRQVTWYARAEGQRKGDARPNFVVFGMGVVRFKVRIDGGVAPGKACFTPRNFKWLLGFHFLFAVEQVICNVS